jgi:hypothetical protein
MRREMEVAASKHPDFNQRAGNKPLLKDAVRIAVAAARFIRAILFSRLLIVY